MPIFVPILAIFVFVLLNILIALIVLKRCLYVIPPNKALVLSGRAYQLQDGSVVGYRVIQHGRVFRIPVIETASWLDLSSMKVSLTVDKAYTADKGEIVLTAKANVKISNDPVSIRNAVERFLGQERAAIQSVAENVLFGQLRNLIAHQPFERVVAEPERLGEEIRPELEKLGLQLDTFEIEQVEVRKRPPSTGPSTADSAKPVAALSTDPSTADSTKPAAAPSAAPYTTPADETDPPTQSAVSLTPADLKKLTDPTLDRSQRETLIKKWTGKKMTLSLNVENITYTTGMDLPPGYRDGRTIIGKTGEGISLEALFPNTQTEQAKALKRGSTAELTTEIFQWNELFSRLTVLVVL